MTMDAIYYAKKLCDTMMRKFNAAQLPPAGKFHYHQGVFLSGMINTYEVCKDERYFEYMKEWVDSIIHEDGSIHSFDSDMLDDIQPGILLIYLYKKTGENKYKIALESLMEILKQWPTNPVGGFWHKKNLSNEMWLDGLYMAGPLEAHYSYEFDDESFLNTAIDQIIIMYDNMQDKNTKLLYHAWDYFGKCEWADKETKLSSEVWGRALGWYVVANLDILEYTPENHPKRQKIIDIEVEILNEIEKYQDDKTGMWFQVVDKGNLEGNWVESSCTALFSYAFAKAVRMGLLDKEKFKIAKRGFEGCINKSVKIEGDDMLLCDVCIGTCVCDYAKYISRSTSVNDLHGAGAFLLMCSEMAKFETVWVF